MTETGSAEKITFDCRKRMLKLLIMMQLKEKLNLKYLQSFRKTLFKVIWLIVEFAAITAACYFILWFFKIYGVFSLIKDVPVSVISIVYSLMLLLSIISTTIGLVKSLYFSGDNQILLTLPAEPSVVFVSKLAVYYIYELKKSIMYIMPVFVAYGILKYFAWYYFPWLIFLFVFLSVLPVVISALLSIPSMYVYQAVKKVVWMQYVLMVLGIGLLAFIAVSVINLIPSNVDIVKSWGTIYWYIQDGLKNYIKYFGVLYALTMLIVGKTEGLTQRLFNANTPIAFLILIVVLCGSVYLCMLLAKPLFYKMASKPFEYKKKANVKKEANKPCKKFFAAIKKEFVSGFRDNSMIGLLCVFVIVLPLATLLLNKVYSAMNTRFLGTQLTVGFNFILILLVMLQNNLSIASIYSRDGAAAYLNKVQPSDYAPLLVSKLVFNILAGFLGVVVTFIVYGSFKPIEPYAVILMGISVYAIYICHLFWSAEMDIMNPQYEQYATFHSQSNNPNENSSALLLFILAIIMFVVVLLLSLEDMSKAWIKICIISIALAAAKIFTFFLKVKMFYKEKQ